MITDWITFSNPVAVWWGFLLVVSTVNIALFVFLHSRLRAQALLQFGIVRVELLAFLGAAYVFGCAFRSILPRADVQRICLFDTWLSSVAVGRTVATLAEICFVIQWAIVLRQLAEIAEARVVRRLSIAVVPLIVVAECCSWYAVITTNYLGNAIENSLWALAFLLIATALLRLAFEFCGWVKLVIVSAVVGISGYLAFLGLVDVPMYIGRWQTDIANGKELLGIFSGLREVSTHWAVTHDISHWGDEIAWMSLYFSVAVWASLALCGFGLVRDRLPSYRRVAGRWGHSRLIGQSSRG